MKALILRETKRRENKVNQRVKQGKKDYAALFDFVFDPRTNIDPKYTIIVK